MPEWVHRGGRHLKKQKRDDAMSSLFFKKKNPTPLRRKGGCYRCGEVLITVDYAVGGVVRFSCSLSRKYPTTISMRPSAPKKVVKIVVIDLKTTIATPSIKTMPGMRPLVAMFIIFFIIWVVRFLRGTDLRCAPRLLIKYAIKKSPPQSRSAVGMGICFFHL